MDIILQWDVSTTIEKCDLLRAGTRKEKEGIQSVRILQLGTGLRRRGVLTGEHRRMRTMTNEEMVDVFSILLQQFPSLERLRIRFRGTSFPIQALSKTLGHAKKLSLIRIFDVKFNVNNTNELLGVAKLLRTHDSLKRVYLDLCQVGEESTHFSLAPIICALAENQNVEEIALSNTRISPENDVDTRLWLEKLCQSSSLKSLKLEMLEELKNEHVICLAQTCDANSSSGLLDLSIESCNVQQSACGALADMIKTNSKLQRFELVLYQNNKKSNADSEEIPKEIDWNDTGMADALLHNVSLKFFRIFAENISLHGYPDAFARVLQSNVQLEYLVLGWDGEKPLEIEFYLMLNRHGRKKLTEKASKKVWVDFLIQHSDDLGVIQYVLKRNPSLAQEMSQF